MLWVSSWANFKDNLKDFSKDKAEDNPKDLYKDKYEDKDLYKVKNLYLLQIVFLYDTTRNKVAWSNPNSLDQLTNKKATA